MKKILLSLFITALVVFIACESKKIAEAQISSKNASVRDCGNLKARFLIIDNGKYSENVRSIRVFMDVSAFSEENLAQMFKYIAAQNSDDKILVIKVLTDWKQMTFPDDCENGTGISEQPLDPARNDFYEATYRRGNNSEYFRFNPVLKSDERKTVILLEKSESKK